MNYSYYLLSLGCPKNQVDAECMSAILKADHFESTSEVEDACFLIVNTCGFIQSAREEAIEAILELADYKEKRRKRGEEAYLIVTGCLSQRYGTEFNTELPEVDAYLGTAAYQDIAHVCKSLIQDKHYLSPVPQKGGSLAQFAIPHRPATEQTYAYLKIAEGCSNCCAYCAIPAIRGPLRSRPLEDLICEAQRFADWGYKELVLVAQDSSRYGLDLYGHSALAELLRRLAAINGIEWIRILYAYSDAVSDEIIEVMASEKKIVHYLDLPIQHASNNVLKAMRRSDRLEDIEKCISKLRQAMPDLVLRTTVMLGFPGESEADYQELLSFVKKQKFDRLGCFAFSAEEGTVAMDMPNQIPDKIKECRKNEVETIASQISADLAKQRVGTECRILLEDVSEDGLYYIGRSFGEAPDIDPPIFVLAQSPDLTIGSMPQCRIVESSEDGLIAISLQEMES